MTAAEKSGDCGIAASESRKPAPAERAMAYREKAERALTLARQSSGQARDTFLFAAHQWLDLAALWTSLAADGEPLPTRAIPELPPPQGGLDERR